METVDEAAARDDEGAMTRLPRGLPRLPRGLLLRQKISREIQRTRLGVDTEV